MLDRIDRNCMFLLGLAESEEAQSAYSLESLIRPENNPFYDDLPQCAQSECSFICVRVSARRKPSG
jgi:hypothetical protein